MISQNLRTNERIGSPREAKDHLKVKNLKRQEEDLQNKLIRTQFRYQIQNQKGDAHKIKYKTSRLLGICKVWIDQ